MECEIYNFGVIYDNSCSVSPPEFESLLLTAFGSPVQGSATGDVPCDIRKSHVALTGRNH